MCPIPHVNPVFMVVKGVRFAHYFAKKKRRPGFLIMIFYGQTRQALISGCPLSLTGKVLDGKKELELFCGH